MRQFTSNDSLRPIHAWLKMLEFSLSLYKKREHMLSIRKNYLHGLEYCCQCRRARFSGNGDKITIQAATTVES
jgi:hypothetical protein